MRAGRGRIGVRLRWVYAPRAALRTAAFNAGFDAGYHAYCFSEDPRPTCCCQRAWARGFRQGYGMGCWEDEQLDPPDSL